VGEGLKACVLHGVGDLRFEDVPDPVRKEGEVLIRIIASGICGSDLPRVLDKGTYHFPTIPGHEIGGEIIEADDSALVGRKCTIFPLLPCRECINCETANYAQCENYNYYGSRCDGGFAQFISVPLWNVVLASNELTFEEIAMTEPCAVALYALEQADIKAGHRVCIFGAGSIGIMIGRWAKLKGAGTVTLIDIDEKKRTFAKELGFEIEINGKYDIVIEGAGVSASYQQAMFVAKTFGTVVLMGNPIKNMDISQKGYWEILRKELTVKGTWNSGYSRSNNTWETVLAFMKQLDISCLVSHRFELSRCNEAFALMSERKEFFNKVMLVNE
jgi:L-iditol 2-dehydrogenase